MGQIISITLSFDNHPWCEYPYLIGKRDEFSIMPDGITAIHERFGKGSVLGYKVSFKNHEFYFPIRSFKNGEIEVVTKMESE